MSSDDDLPLTPLGAYIRQQRELHAMSLRQLAHMAGISNPYLSQIEHGLREPSERVLDALADSLEVSADALHQYAARDRPAPEDGEDPAVVAAIKADRSLTARQRVALLEVYAAFTAAAPPDTLP
jgi:transcriptional regulator with XRE-family HTH domain